MLSFDIRSLESKAVQVDGELRPDDPIWQEGDPLPSRPVRVTGRLSSSGSGRFYWHGRIEGDATLSCRRCLSDTSVHVKEDDIHLIFAETGSEEADDPDVHLLDPRAKDLDLRPAIREQWLLSAPRYALCREDCKGLCATCGAELNAGPCDCPSTGEARTEDARPTDARWDALRKLNSSSN